MNLSVRDMCTYWNDHTKEVAWIRPPVLTVPGVGCYQVTSLFITTTTDKAYNLYYQDFFRLMVIRGVLKLVHDDGREEQVLTAHGTYLHPLDVKSLYAHDNIIYLPIKPKTVP